MKIISANVFEEQWCKRKRAFQFDKELDDTVLAIISDVRTKGDQALRHYTERFDQVALNHLRVSQEEFAAAKKLVSKQFLTAMKAAKENITIFHNEQKEHSWFINPTDGVMLGQKVSPIPRVGIYIPGGKAAYPSTVLMAALPAKIAGVASIAITTPADKDGNINPHVLIAAEIAGVDEVYKVGGAQAIAALAYGTESITKADKIVGPGNAYVARAKKWVYGDVAIDMIAGPSEICVVADETCNPRFVAADLLSQAEHDEDATAICITTDENIADMIQQEVMIQLEQLERREIAAISIAKNSCIVITKDVKQAFHLTNLLAPEHLQIVTANPMDKLPLVQNAGAIFLGSYAPEVLGDYFAGPNHTLPTNGTAAFASPLGVYDFLKKSSIIQYSQSALTKAAAYIETIAETEGLEAHAKAITTRLHEQMIHTDKQITRKEDAVSEVNRLPEKQLKQR